MYHCRNQTEKIIVFHTMLQQLHKYLHVSSFVLFCCDIINERD